MSRKPRIGISSAERTAGGEWNEGARAYAAAVTRFGGVPVPIEDDAARLEESLAGIDGVLLRGGADVDPARYGRARHPATNVVSKQRDEAEIELVRLVRLRRIPVLCICRGLQVANVAFGGTLLQHLPEVAGTRSEVVHEQTGPGGIERYEHAPGHTVTIEQGSALASLIGASRVPTNGMHHQAVDAPAPDFVAVARTPDGVIEALEPRFEHPFFFAVQWHPEELLADSASAALFGGLIAAARARRRGNPTAG